MGIMMRRLVFLMVLAFTAPLFASSTAQEVLNKAKQASGGDAWNAMRTTHASLKLETSGLNGPLEIWEDNLTGRSLVRYQLGPASGAEGFDGKTVWSEDSSGQAQADGGEEARKAAVNEAYRRTRAYWFPQRWPAQVEYSGEKEESGRKFNVLRITPKGGRPFDLWIDAGTYLFDRTVEKAEIETRTSYFSDYRTVNGVKVAFAERTTKGDAKYDQTVTMEKIEFNQAIEDSRFEMPRPPAPDFGLAGGKTSTTIPFQLINNHIYVDVKLNGKGPYRVLCDTGGENIVTPTLAGELGLKPQGALEGRGVGEKSEDVGLVKIGTLEVGEATLSNQLFAVFPMESFAVVEGIPENGLIGFEVFRRFVVQVDYEHGMLTLTIPSAFSYRGQGTVVPFEFNGHTPQVDGEIDGIAGKFDIDTGSRSSLDLLRGFVEKHDLVNHYDARVEAVTGWGVGGAARSLVTRARLLKLGSVEIASPVTELSVEKKGAFSSEYVAGNVGAGVLKRFNITFDYPGQKLIFEANANFRKPDAYDRSGMWLNRAGEVFEVVDVTPGGAAALAGVKVGDRIQAIDGRAAAQLSLPGVRHQFSSDPAGTKLSLTVQSGAEVRELELVLKDLV